MPSKTTKAKIVEKKPSIESQKFRFLMGDMILEHISYIDVI